MKRTLFFTLLVVGAFVNHTSPASQALDNEDPTQQLFDAIKDHNIDQVKSCLARGADVNARNPWSCTPLHCAAYTGGRLTAAIASELIQAGAKVNAREKKGYTSLHLAISSYFSKDASTNQSDIVAVLLQHGADVHARDESQETPLHLAACANALDSLTLLLQHGAEIHARDKYERTPLHGAAHSKKLNAVIRLIEAGADVNAKDDVGNTPLHLAISCYGSNEGAYAASTIVTVLLQHGADVNVIGFWKQTPLYRVAYLKGLEATIIAKQLIKAGAKVNVEDDMGNTPLHKAAASYGSTGFARVILSLLNKKSESNS